MPHLRYLFEFTGRQQSDNTRATKICLSCSCCPCASADSFALQRCHPKRMCPNVRRILAECSGDFRGLVGPNVCVRAPFWFPSGAFWLTTGDLFCLQLELFCLQAKLFLMSIKFPPAILGPEMAAPILWAPCIFWFFGGRGEVPILFLWAWGFFRFLFTMGLCVCVRVFEHLNRL